MDFVVFGGGCFGSFYTGQLLKAAARDVLEVGRITVIDRDPGCAVVEHFGNDARVEVALGDWRAYGTTLLERTDIDEVHWVPAPLAPHVLYLWLSDALGARRIAWRELALEPPSLPFAQPLDSGSLALSHAPGMCPVHCIEPRRCPLTRDVRDWEMTDTVRAHLADAPVAVEPALFVCRHLVYGVGTIPVAEIQAAHRRLDALPAGHHVAVGTLSACHGIVDVFVT